ncbi:MAG: hypothetical protein RSC57_01810, partial [Bacilli bacterium]
MERFIRRFKNKYFALSFVTVLFSIICLTSYGVFIISTSKYRASEMYLGNLIYQINLESLTPTTATISGKDVNLTAANATSTIFMNVRSLNPVRSRYNVEYKVKTGAAIVKYSNVTPWKPNGLLDSTDEIVFEKKIKITIINTSSSPATVSLDVAGGYAYTNDADVKTISGFTKFINDNPSNMYDGSSAKSVKVLSSRVKNDTSCTPTIDTPCLYGGETQRNYVSYSNEVYRIIGLYLIDNVETVKLIKDTNYRTPSTYTDSQNTLHTWKNDLFLPIDYVRESSPFCSSDVLSCTTPLQSYGLITKKEYERVGAHYSFINKGADFLTGTLNGNNVYYVKSDGSISQIASSTQSNLKPVFYLQDGVKAKNTGTESNPYELSFRGDIFVHSITIDGVASPSTPTTGSYAMQNQCTCDDEVCSDATDIQWNNTTHTIDYVMGPGTPTLYCNFSFLKGDVIFSSIIVNGKKASSTPLESGYTMTSTCTGGSAVWDDVNHKVITQVISGPLVCDLEFTKPLAVSLNAYGGTLSSNNLVIAKNSSATASLTPTTGFVSLGTGVKCSTGITGSVSGNTITINTTNQNSGTCDIVASK